MEGIHRLGEELAGEMLLPGEPGYDEARRPALPQFGQIRPAAVVRCATDDDVARTLAFARETGMPLAPRSGGHCFAGSSSTTGILLDLSPMRSVSVDGSGIATLGAGARLADVYAGLAAHDRMLPLGCGPTVGIAGLTLGGGLGLLGRRYGLTCDRLRGARVVLSDGRVLDCDEDHEPDLFWALRGAGGGHVGVVTSLVFDTVPNPSATKFLVHWPTTAAAAVAAAWQEWAPDAPDEVSGELRITATSDQLLVFVFGIVVGDSGRAAALVEDLCDHVGVPPASEVVETAAYTDLKGSLSGLGPPTDPSWPVASRSEFFGRSLPADALTALLDEFVRDLPAAGHRELNFMPMGGAFNRVAPGATAFAHRTDRFLLEHVAVHPGGDPTGWAHRSWSIVHPSGTGRTYPNFPSSGVPRSSEIYLGANTERLAEVKREYDAAGLFGGE